MCRLVKYKHIVCWGPSELHSRLLWCSCNYITNMLPFVFFTLHCLCFRGEETLQNTYALNSQVHYFGKSFLKCVCSHCDVHTKAISWTTATKYCTTRVHLLTSLDTGLNSCKAGDVLHACMLACQRVVELHTGLGGVFFHLYSQHFMYFILQVSGDCVCIRSCYMN